MNRRRFFFFALVTLFCEVCAASDIASFYEIPDLFQTRLSPAGHHVAAVRTVGESDEVVLINPQDGKRRTLYKGRESGDDVTVSQIYWIDNRYLGISLSEKVLGVQDILDTALRKQFLIVDVQANDLGDSNGIYSVRSAGWFAHSLSQEEGRFLYSKSGRASKLYQIDVEKLARVDAVLGKLDRIDGGQFVSKNAIKTVDGFVLKWFFNQADEVVSALLYGLDNTLQLHEFLDGEEVEVLYSWGEKKKKKKKKSESRLAETSNSNLENYNPVSISDMAGTYYAFSTEEEEKRSIYRVDYINKTVDKIFTTDAYEISTIYVDSKNRFIGARVNRDGYYIDEMSGLEREFSSSEGRLRVSLDETRDGSLKLIYQSAHNKPGEIRLVDEVNKQSYLISRSLPNVPQRFASRQFEGVLDRGGVNVPFILNRPNKGSQFPLIVMPHGGPIGVHDSPYFDRDVQLLVDQGYAVLRTNYRGSSGFSPEFEALGKRQWGSQILEDIIATIDKVTELPDIDGQKVCLFGASYGGYAAVELATRHPERFRCAASHAGVYDLPLYLRSSIISEAREIWTKEYIGDVENEYEALKQISPLYKARDLDRPVLLVHGAKDEVVDQEHFFRYKFALERAGKDAQFILEPEMGHHYADLEITARVMTATLEFLADHLKN